MNLAVRRERKRMGVAEFIALIRPAPDEERWELIDGEPILMAPQSERHQVIVANLIRALGPAAERQGCRTLPGLGLLNDFRDDYAPIPDLVVRCGPILPDGYARDPLLVAEVLSPSTMNHDRGSKTEFFKELQTLMTFMIVYQDEVRVEAWQKRPGGDWAFSVHGRDSTIPLPELQATLAVRDVYRNLEIA